jgi:hypothetical protein
LLQALEMNIQSNGHADMLSLHAGILYSRQYLTQSSHAADCSQAAAAHVILSVPAGHINGILLVSLTANGTSCKTYPKMISSLSAADHKAVKKPASLTSYTNRGNRR